MLASSPRIERSSASSSQPRSSRRRKRTGCEPRPAGSTSRSVHFGIRWPSLNSSAWRRRDRIIHPSRSQLRDKCLQPGKPEEGASTDARRSKALGAGLLAGRGTDGPAPYPRDRTTCWRKRGPSRIDYVNAVLASLDSLARAMAQALDCGSLTLSGRHGPPDLVVHAGDAKMISSSLTEAQLSLRLIARRLRGVPNCWTRPPRTPVPVGEQRSRRRPTRTSPRTRGPAAVVCNAQHHLQGQRCRPVGPSPCRGGRSVSKPSHPLATRSRHGGSDVAVGSRP